MSPLSRAVFALLACLSVVPAIVALNRSFPYGHEKIRGVNLGGWFVIESFTTPTLFDNTNDTRIGDEYTFGLYQDRNKAQNALEAHWSTFIIEQDFAEIADAGLNHVRIPVGHWILDVSPDEPYHTGQLPYLLKAVEWAEKYGLHVIIALYGAPGSQNGFVNSGWHRDAAYWHTNSTNVERTYKVMNALTEIFREKSDVVSVIQVMNEAAGFRDAILNPPLLAVLKQYYYNAYDIIRNPSAGKKPSNYMVMLHDGFQQLSYWDDFMPEDKYEGVLMDTNIYQMFNDHDSHMTYDEHIQRACQNSTIMSQSPLMTIIGEWTATNNDCAPHLLGRFVPSRYDGSLPGSTRVGSCVGLTGDASTFSAEYKEFMRMFWEAQTMAYERGGEGWVMWTWKMENADEWSYQAGLRHGWIPNLRDPAPYKYPNICGW